VSETRKLAAILVADVVGYSRLTGADEDRILARLRTLRSDLIDPTIAVHHGRVVKRTGDGAIVEFRSVVDAVHFAVEIQRAMVERNAEVAPDKRIEFRIGIHLGDVVEESDGDLMGDGVNIAARLEGIAKPGAVCLSEQAYWQVKGRLDLKVTDLGPTQLKNIAEPIRVYSLEVGKPIQSKPLTVPAPEKSAPPRLSIIVLPFKNLSGDSSQEYFADGVTENLTTDLSRIRNSFVIARSTAFTFKGKSIDARQTAQELGVRYVLEGSVQRGQNRVRVNAQLIDGETGAHLWADRFDEDLADLFELQDQVVARLANTLNFELTKAEAAKGARSINPDATDLVMRGRAITNGVAVLSSKEKNNAARALFEQALAIDPDNVEAIVGVAARYGLEYLMGWGNSGIDYDAKILPPLDRAISLAPHYVYAYTSKSNYLAASRRPDDALRIADAGIALNPNIAFLYMSRALAELALGRFDEAKSDMQKAIRLSPRDSWLTLFHVTLGDAEIGAGRPEAAIAEYRMALDAGDHTYWVYANLAAAYALSGKPDKANPLVAETLRINPSFTVKWFQNHTAYVIPKRDEGFRKAGFAEE
jgi:adenylate cyclase